MRNGLPELLLFLLLSILLVGCQPNYTDGSNVEAPNFSILSGLYDTTISVKINCATAEAKIRYTTDGTDPTEMTGNLYSGPLSVSRTLTLKALAYRDGWTSSTVSSADYRIRSTELDLTVRDFTPLTNADFENSSIGSDLGIIQDTIGGDHLPVYDHAGATLTVHSPTSFSQWFHDTSGVNVTLSYVMTLSELAGTWSSDNTDFFPIDGQGFGNTPSYSHNYHFTVETHGSFYYEGTGGFDITANDDTWLFINGHLVIDMGGIHAATAGSVTLDASMAAACGIEPSNTYQFDLFHTQRHTTASVFIFSTTATLLKMYD